MYSYVGPMYVSVVVETIRNGYYFKISMSMFCPIDVVLVVF